jgi:DNA-binding MarR family transcriptional regulator/N-acetylglutamate synthase-like GNAT family acetyltransferase
MAVMASMAASSSSADAHDDPVQTLRRFNRFYTAQIGVVNEHLVDSEFSMSEMRVLYELAHRDQPTAGALSKDLGLDPGYLSRMLRTFEKRGLLSRSESRSDARQNLLSLTPEGRKTFAPLEARWQEQMVHLLENIPPTDRKRLVEAMHTIEAILGKKRDATPSYLLRRHRPGDMGWVVQRHGDIYWQEYRYDERFEAFCAEIVAYFVLNLDPQCEACWIAEKDGENVGSVFVVRKSKTVAKLRLLLVEPSARRLGIGRRLVEECIRFSRDAGYKKMVLWTQSELHAARHLYQQAGFKVVDRQRHDSFGRKGLVAETWELKL